MMRITKFVNPKDVNKKWYLIDAQGRSIGRVAVQAAMILRGKNKPTFSPHVNMGDNVIIINTAMVKTTGKKIQQKIYYRHSGYVGNMKKTVLADMLTSKPEYAMQHAVRLMLPKNKLGRKMLKGLRVYGDDKYPKNIKAEKVE